MWGKIFATKFALAITSGLQNLHQTISKRGNVHAL